MACPRPLASARRVDPAHTDPRVLLLRIDEHISSKIEPPIGTGHALATRREALPSPAVAPKKNAYLIADTSRGHPPTLAAPAQHRSRTRARSDARVPSTRTHRRA